MTKDFARAGRALSLLLRDQIGGHNIDIRSEGRWGIGAEILLRRGTQHEQGTHVAESMSGATDHGTGVMAPSRAPFYTWAGLEDAKRYYERLTIQYPFHKLATTTANALDFYTAMFGLWIYVAHEEGKAADESEATAPESHIPFAALSSLHSAKSRELERAREIAGRMDAAMSTFPYSDDLELIRLRGMVALWVADLIDFGLHHQHGGMVRRAPMDNLPDAVSTMEPSRAENAHHHVSLLAEAARSRQMAQDMFVKGRRPLATV